MPAQLETLASRFLMLPGAILGHGPLHSTDPNPETGRRIERFLAEYPFLEEYPDYVLFLKTFSGAAAAGALHDGPGICDEDYLFVSIYGFDESNDQLLELSKSDIVDQRGFFGFCELHYRYKPDEAELTALDGVAVAEFCLDATGERRPGIYVECVLDGASELGIGKAVRFCDSFTQWFEQLAEQKGRIPAINWVFEHFHKDG